MRVLFDTNVIIDVLQDRAPWSADGKALFLAAANRKIDGCVTEKQLADIYYISKKQIAKEENTEAKCRRITAGIISIFEVLDTLGSDCQNAIVYENNDYEDAIMIATAVRCGVDCIVTRDSRHFRSAPLEVLTPGELIEKADI